MTKQWVKGRKMSQPAVGKTKSGWSRASRRWICPIWNPKNAFRMEDWILLQLQQIKSRFLMIQEINETIIESKKQSKLANLLLPWRIIFQLAQAPPCRLKWYLSSALVAVTMFLKLFTTNCTNWSWDWMKLAYLTCSSSVMLSFVTVCSHFVASLPPRYLL